MLWKVTEEVDRDAELLRAHCERATEEQLILLHRRFGIAAGELYADERFARGATSAERRRLACWVVTQGKRAWLDAKSDPARVLPVPPEVPDFPGTMADVYEERFGGAIPDQEPDPVGTRSLAPTPESEETLWKVIDVINAGVPPAEALSSFTRSELIQLDLTINAITDRTIHGPLASRVEEETEEEWFQVVWKLIARGRDAYEEACHNVEALSIKDTPRPGTSLPEQIGDVYYARYGDFIPYVDLETSTD